MTEFPSPFLQAIDAARGALPSATGPGGVSAEFSLGWQAAMDLVGEELGAALRAAQPLLQYTLASDVQALLAWRTAIDADPMPNAPPPGKYPIDWAAAYPRLWSALDEACESMEMSGLHADPAYQRLKALHAKMAVPIDVKAQRATVKKTGVSILGMSLIETGRCLGIAQQQGDEAAIAYWQQQVDHYAGLMERDLVCRPIGLQDLPTVPEGPDLPPLFD